MKAALKRAWAWLLALVNDPAAAKPSSARVLAFLCGVAGIVFAFVHPDKPETLLVLLGAGTGNLAFRARGAAGSAGDSAGGAS